MTLRRFARLLLRPNFIGWLLTTGFDACVHEHRSNGICHELLPWCSRLTIDQHSVRGPPHGHLSPARRPCR